MMEAVDGALVIRLMMVLLTMFSIMRVIGVLDVVSRLVIGHEPLEGCLVVPDRPSKSSVSWYMAPMELWSDAAQAPTLMAVSAAVAGDDD